VRIIPVIDLKDGLVVRGVGGRREEYRPIVSRLTPSARALDVASALINAVHPAELYLADLGAIGGRSPAWDVYRELWSLGLPLWVDAGVRSAQDAVALAEAGAAGVVCGLETLAGPAVLQQAVARLGAERIIFSLDLKDGQLLGNPSAWRVAPGAALAMVDRVKALGVRRLIVLDLADVGEARGVGTLELCRTIASAHAELEIYTGGGVRGPEDLAQLDKAGVTGALVASALHSGDVFGPTVP
jgi:phosphoribosylformimino-5-aminoimidazole carboxamide ribotide isomerase